MNLTNKQKLYGVLLGVGLAALSADRLLIGTDIGPDQASAEPAQAYAGWVDRLPGLAVVVAQPSRNTRNRDQAVGDRVAALARREGVDVSQVRDAFVPARSWLPESEPIGVVKKASGMSPEQFRLRHQMMAVVITDEASFVVVDGKTLQAGELVDGYRLVEIRERSAVFESQGQAVELMMLFVE